MGVEPVKVVKGDALVCSIAVLGTQSGHKLVHPAPPETILTGAAFPETNILFLDFLPSDFLIYLV